MSLTDSLSGLLTESARRFPDRTAVCVPGGESVTYAELDARAALLRDRLWHVGVRPGDRVGLRLHKGIDAVVAIFGILRAGAAYVPVDAESPAPRGAFILNDCQVKAVVTEHRLERVLGEELNLLGGRPAMIVVDPDRPEGALQHVLAALQQSDPAPVVDPVKVSPDDIAYILYTSGSTGNPKGVVLSQRNAASFIDWCSEVFEPRSDDVFSSHAPFHFDLSILDIFVSIKHGARLVLISESLGKDPAALAAAIANERISIWYSTPSILSLLAHYGKLDRLDYSALRLVFFAGEVFPIPQFQALWAFWRKPRFFNLYGPTETNVCTFYEVPADDSWKQMKTFPIGGICPPNEGIVVDEKDQRVAAGEPGELLVSGSNVMRGYWNLSEQNAQAFLLDSNGVQWYRTGDIVVDEGNGQYRYLNRRDRMVKRRGYRVELGEIEAGLGRHPSVREVAVIATPDPESGVRIVAFIGLQGGEPLTIIALKSFCSQALPPYMIPDAFKVLDALPRTSTNKVDLQALKSQL